MPEESPYRVQGSEDSSGEDEQEQIAQEYSLSSRTAENLFWVGRYAERAQTTARLLRTILQQRAELVPQGFAQGISEGSSSTDTAFIQALLRTLTQMTMTYPGFIGNKSEERLLHP